MYIFLISLNRGDAISYEKPELLDKFLPIERSLVHSGDDCGWK